jgi:membrane protease YdiL (CAAX protease family)
VVDPDSLEAPGPPGAAAQAPEPFRFVRFGLLFYGAMAVVAVLWRQGWYGEALLYASPEAERLGISPVRDLALGVAAGALVVVLSHWLTRRTGWGERLARALAGSLGRLSIPDALLLAVASGLAEEMLFRGALQPRAGWLVASLLFGLMHFVPRREFLPWTVFAVLAGMLFGWLFATTGNLVAPVAAHMIVNGINLPILVRRYGPAAAGTDQDSAGSSGSSRCSKTRSR